MKTYADVALNLHKERASDPVYKEYVDAAIRDPHTGSCRCERCEVLTFGEGTPSEGAGKQGGPSAWHERYKGIVMEFLNLTPHKLNIHNERVLRFSIEPSGDVARVAVEYKLKGYIDGVPIYEAEYGDVEGLPDPQRGVLYIVSSLVKAAVPDREDVLSPGELIRDEDGRPIGCRGLKA